MNSKNHYLNSKMKQQLRFADWSSHDSAMLDPAYWRKRKGSHEFESIGEDYSAAVDAIFLDPKKNKFECDSLAMLIQHSHG